MNAQRIILNKDGTRKVLFDEKCLCGNPEITIDPSKPTFATCLSCLRVMRRMVWGVLEGRIEIWGIYFDPYLANTLAGQFINCFILTLCGHLFDEKLEPQRYPIDEETV